MWAVALVSWCWSWSSWRSSWSGDPGARSATRSRTTTRRSALSSTCRIGSAAPGPPGPGDLGPRPVPGERSGRTGGAPVPVRGTDEFPDPDAPIVFDDARPVERGSAPAARGSTDRSARSAGPSAMALDSMNHRRRPGTGVMVAVPSSWCSGPSPWSAADVPRTAHGSSHRRTTTTHRRGPPPGPPPTASPVDHPDDRPRRRRCRPSSWPPRRRPRHGGHLHRPPRHLPDHARPRRDRAGSRSTRPPRATPSGPERCPPGRSRVQASGTTDRRARRPRR